MSEYRTTQENTDDPGREKVRVIPLKYVDDFPGHPFKVLEDEDMVVTALTIEKLRTCRNFCKFFQVRRKNYHTTL